MTKAVGGRELSVGAEVGAVGVKAAKAYRGCLVDIFGVCQWLIVRVEVEWSGNLSSGFDRCDWLLGRRD